MRMAKEINRLRNSKLFMSDTIALLTRIIEFYDTKLQGSFRIGHNKAISTFFVLIRITQSDIPCGLQWAYVRYSTKLCICLSLHTHNCT